MNISYLFDKKYFLLITTESKFLFTAKIIVLHLLFPIHFIEFFKLKCLKNSSAPCMSTWSLRQHRISLSVNRKRDLFPSTWKATTVKEADWYRGGCGGGCRGHFLHFSMINWSLSEEIYLAGLPTNQTNVTFVALKSLFHTTAE